MLGTAGTHCRPDPRGRRVRRFRLLSSFRLWRTVAVRDTTGAGDGFRAGIVYGLLKGHRGAGLIRVGSAVAALVCSQVPGVLHSPNETELSAFLASNP